MKLHTKLTSHDISEALENVKQHGLVTEDISFVQFAYESSRSHANGYLIQLGTTNKYSLPSGKKRHYKNSGDRGADMIWAATYDEWGWFIAEIFDRDPNAKFGYYKSRDDFNEQTKWKFA
jgi:hypothetical protein